MSEENVDIDLLKGQLALQKTMNADLSEENVSLLKRVALLKNQLFGFLYTKPISNDTLMKELKGPADADFKENPVCEDCLLSRRDSEVEDLKQKLIDTQESARLISEDLAAAQSARDQWHRCMQETSERNDKLRKELTELRQKHSMHIAQVDAQRNAQGRDEARNELRQCKQEIIELKAAICNKNETIAAQSRQYERLSLELGEVKTKNFANINRRASLQRQVGELEARLHGNIGNFEEYLKAENKKLQDKIEELWADNRQRAESYGELKRDYADIRSTNEAYIRENARLLAERDELKGRGRLAVADAEISGEVKPLNEGMKAAKPLCPSCHFLENCPTRPKEGDVATCKDYQNHDSV